MQDPWIQDDESSFLPDTSGNVIHHTTVLVSVSSMDHWVRIWIIESLSAQYRYHHSQARRAVLCRAGIKGDSSWPSDLKGSYVPWRILSYPARYVAQPECWCLSTLQHWIPMLPVRILHAYHAKLFLTDKNRKIYSILFTPDWIFCQNSCVHGTFMYNAHLCNSELNLYLQTKGQLTPVKKILS